MKVLTVLKPIIFAAALGPAAVLVYDAFTGDLTANPIEYITNTTGLTALTFLLITLGITPLRRIAGWNDIIRLRRMLGLFAFFYACLHFLTWFVLDQFFDFATMAEDIVERPFITLGMATLLLLIPLAVTSTGGMIRRLGRRWQELHRLIYVAAVLGVIHYWLGQKADFRDPRFYAVALSALLGFRAWWMWRTRVSSPS